VQVGLVILVSMMVNMPYLLYADLIWISCSEGVSVLENLDAMGVPFPTFIREVLEKTKTTTEDTVNKQ
jgi:phage-related holin